MTIMIVVAVTGAGLVTGLLFAFSNFVMKAFADLPNDQGMFAMQRVNDRIINPVFLAIFFGTPILCLVIAIRSVLHLGEPGSSVLLAGAIAYLFGPLGITLRFNVPLNDRLAKAEPTVADEAWPTYQKQWQRWNHVRTCIGILSILLLAAGLGLS